jgi:hypothetical protein
VGGFEARDVVLSRRKGGVREGKVKEEELQEFYFLSCYC